METVRIGQAVPDFKLETYDPAQGTFGEFSLEKTRQAGKWTVVVFYPADYTFVGPTELADVADKQDELAKAGAAVVSVSTDTKFVHLAWQREEKLLSKVRFPMAADPTGKVSRLFGVYNEDNGLNLRGTFIISPEGKLTCAEVNFYNVGRSAAELLRKVKACAYLAKNPAEACPANWDEGAKTLKPGAELVGRVAQTLQKA
jgi:peroxiredoxin (alkyl hydroperoxide reductase subunit C)